MAIQLLTFDIVEDILLGKSKFIFADFIHIASWKFVFCATRGNAGHGRLIGENV